VVADPATSYAKAVVKGTIVAGPYVRLACARHLRDIKDAKKLGLEWRPGDARDVQPKGGTAAHVIRFFERFLQLEDGRPFVLEPWQSFIVGSLFGWHQRDGRRRFRTAFVEAGKGSGKTPLAAGIGLYGLVADAEAAPEIYSAATARHQAAIAYRDAQRMIEASAELRDVVTSEVSALSIPSRTATFRAVSSEHRSLDGLRVHIGLIDELHEHPTPLVVDKLRAGTKGRRNALIFEITNSGYDRTSVCWNHHSYSIQVLEGTVPNAAWFAYLCALDPGDDWKDEACWPKANPSLGTVLPVSYLREQVQEAVGMPSKENIVRRLNFCEWTEQATRAISAEIWARGNVAVDGRGIDPVVCYGGLDLASVNDLTALSLLAGPYPDGHYDFVLRCWASEAAVKARGDRVPYALWAREGWLSVTPGEIADYAYVERQVLEDVARFNVRAIAFGRWNSSSTVTRLRDQLGPDRLIEHGQGFADMNGPTKELLRLLPEGRLHHGGNPLAAWMASNLALAQDAAGNLKPDKEKSGDKIDGITALVMALALHIRQPAVEQPFRSVYEDRGILMI
jgi:phage terminase large subunit-like protein